MSEVEEEELDSGDRLDSWLQQAEGTAVALSIGRIEVLLAELRQDVRYWDAAHSAAVCVHLANAVSVSRHAAAQQRVDARLLGSSRPGADDRPSAGRAAREGNGGNKIGLADEARLRLDLYGREVLPDSPEVSLVLARRRQVARQSFNEARAAREYLDLPAAGDTSDFELRRLVQEAENVAQALAPWGSRQAATLPAAHATPLTPDEINRCLAPAPPAAPPAGEASGSAQGAGLRQDFEVQSSPARVDWAEYWASEAAVTGERHRVDWDAHWAAEGSNDAAEVRPRRKGKGRRH